MPNVSYLTKLRDQLKGVVQTLDALLADGPCIHDNKQEMTTMGKDNRTFLCLDCGLNWEEPWTEIVGSNGPLEGMGHAGRS